MVRHHQKEVAMTKLYRLVRLGDAKKLTRIGVGQMNENGLFIAQIPTA